VSRSRTERLLLSAGGVLDASGQVWPELAAWCAAHAGARIELLLAADCAHSLCVPEDLPLADEAALLRYARLQFTHYFGTAAQHWPLAAWPHGVCALAEGDLASLRTTAAAHRVRITSMRPSWTLAPAQDGDTAIVDGSMLTRLSRHGGRLVELQQRHTDNGLTSEFDGARVMHAKELLGQTGGQAGPDFIAQPPRTRPLVWAWAASAAAACALIAMQAQEQREEGRRLAEQAAVLDRIARPTSTAKAKPPSPAARSRAWAVSSQLGTDWVALWTDVERALPPGLQLAAMDLDRQSLRLEGQAAEPDAVTRLVDRLALQVAPDEEVVLTRLQKPDTPAEEGAPLRFELVRRAGAKR